jgi:hypothetical protein
MGSLGPVSSRFVRRVRTASGAVAVQLVVKDHGEVVEIEHVGSAHTDAELALLLAAANEWLQPGQQSLDTSRTSRLSPPGSVTSQTGRVPRPGLPFHLHRLRLRVGRSPTVRVGVWWARRR